MHLSNLPFGEIFYARNKDNNEHNYFRNLFVLYLYYRKQSARL